MGDKLKSFFKSRNNLLILLLVGVLLMVISLPTDKDKTEETNNNTSYLNEEKVESYDEMEYIEQMEKKVEQLLGQMEGAGEVRVIITLHSSEERIVEKDMPVVRSNTTEEDAQGGRRDVSTVDAGESTVYGGGSQSEPYVVKTISPQVEGVLILAQGAGSGSVSKNLSEAVQVLFGIDAHRIKVVKMGED